MCWDDGLPKHVVIKGNMAGRVGFDEEKVAERRGEEMWNEREEHRGQKVIIKQKQTG